MPVRLYELAKEINYALNEIYARKDDVGLIANSPFSIVPDVIADKIRGSFEKREENPCIHRKKPKVKRPPKKKAALKPKKKEIKISEQGEEPIDEVTPVVIEEAIVNPAVEKDASESAVVKSEEIVEEKVHAVEEKSEPSNKLKKDETKEANDGDGKKVDPNILGKVVMEEDDDSFEVGRIVSPSPTQNKAQGKRKRKRNLVDPMDRMSEWNQKFGNITAQPLPKKTQHETKGSKLQRMQLVYGHELPKKLRTRMSSRSSKPVEDTNKVQVPISIRDLSEKIGIKATDVIKYLMTQGEFMTITDQIGKDVAETIATQFEVEVEFTEVREEKQVLKEIAKQDQSDAELESRPPVITIMGHVDHGKTSLLDCIRNSRLAEKEAGGITQHIGGYQVEKNGQLLTFLDTPGHAAFTSMRARGANITDIVIIVVAADDGMMPQTEEAINHAKAAGVPVIVAINKMDLEGANPNRIKEQLSTLELIPEEWSGSTPYVPVSALKGDGIEDLLEMILLQAEMLELKADYKSLGEGVVIEAHMETGRGVVASILVRQGYLKKGDPVLCGRGHGWLRQMVDEEGKEIKKAGPSKIIKLTGLSECPSPGDLFNVMPNIKKAKELAEERTSKYREDKLKEKQALTMDSLMAKLSDQEIKELNVVIKADVQGSVEALEQALSEIGNEEVRVKVVHRGVGAVAESDILLSKASEAVVLAFRVSADSKARRLANDEGVEIRNYNIIYELLEEVQSSLEGMLDPDSVESIVGEVEVQQVFRISNIGNIAGSYVKSGYVERNLPARLIRDGVVVYTGKIQALRRFKEDVKRVEQRYECGIRLENFDDIRVDDIIEPYAVEAVKKTLD